MPCGPARPPSGRLPQTRRCATSRRHWSSSAPSAYFDLRLKIDLLIGLGTAQRQVGDQTFKTTLLEAARRARDLGDGERLVKAALANSRGFFFSSLGVIDTERVEMLEAALEALPDADSSSRARLLSRLCNELAFGPLERRLSLAREAKAMARRIGDAATRVEVTSDCMASLRIPSTLDECRADLLETLALAEGLDDPVPKFGAAAHMAIEAVRTGDFELGAASLAAQAELAAKLQQPTLVWLATYMRERTRVFMATRHSPKSSPHRRSRLERRAASRMRSPSTGPS